jgi:cadmium resistance transport/sequestration family protein
MEIIVTSIVAFVSTNIDDIFLLMLFFSNNRFQPLEIIAGQLLGIVALIVISVIGSLVGLIIDPVYIGLLGLFPIYLGAKELLGENEDDETLDGTRSGKTNVMAVTGVTIANGGDNVGIYIPLFTTLSWMNKSIMITIFLLLTVAWCFFAKYLTHHPLLAKSIERYGKVVTPIVLILLGVYILYENGTIRWIMGLI